MDICRLKSFVDSLSIKLLGCSGRLDNLIYKVKTRKPGMMLFKYELGASLKDKIFGNMKVFVGRVELDDLYYNFQLIPTKVNVYDLNTLLPLDIINVILSKINDIHTLKNMFRFLDITNFNEKCRVLYLIRSPQEYVIMERVLNIISVIVGNGYWADAYSTKICDTPDRCVTSASKLYSEFPDILSTFTKIFQDYKLGDRNDYMDWIIHDRSHGKWGVHLYLGSYEHIKVGHIDMLFDLITGKVTFNEHLTGDEYQLAWFNGTFMPYIMGLRMFNLDIDYLRFIPYSVLLDYIKYADVSDPRIPSLIAIELYKRNPTQAINDIIN